MASRSILSATLRLRAAAPALGSSALPRRAAPVALAPTTPVFNSWSTRSYAAGRPKKGGAAPAKGSGSDKAAESSSTSSNSSDAAGASSPSSQPSSSSPSPESPTEAQAAAAAAAAESAESAAAATPRQRSSSAFDIDTTLTAIADGAGEGGEGGDKSGSGRTGARARSSAEQSSLDRSRRTTRRIFLLLGASGLGIFVGNMARDWETVEERERFAGNPDGESALGRIKLRLKAQWEDFNAPVFEKLLPDLLPFPYQRPYTLCVDLDDLLVHSHWTREHGWRTAKRPGLDYFLGYLGQFYEVVLFTTQPYYLAAPIIEKLDPDRRFFTYTLFRESCRTVDGKVVKDLSHLNRDLARVILLDTEPERASLQPENAVLLRKWAGDRKDTELVDALPFLEAIGIYNIQDVRTPIKHYEGTHVPTEYNRRQREIKAAQVKEWEESRGSASGGGGGRSWFSGFKGGAAVQSGDANGPPKTWYDTERERYLAAYLEDVKYWQENGEAIRQQAKEEQEKQMKEMKLSAWGMLTGQGLQPPGMEQGQQQQQQQK